MTNYNNNNNKNPKSVDWVALISSALIIAGFFLPWVSWSGTHVSGYHFPTGKFYQISLKNFSLGNPMPQFSFVNAFFWLIPFFSIINFVLLWRNKKNIFFAVIAGMMALALVTVFILFTDTLIDLGADAKLPGSLLAGLWLTVIASVATIWTSVRNTRTGTVKAILFVCLGPLITWLGFLVITKYIMDQTFDDTRKIKADFIINANDLLNEFKTNDSLANTRYRERTLTVNGRVGVNEPVNDSTVNIKMTDSTGSYIIFTFHDEELKKAKNLKEGDSISVKGSCSGGVYSDILSAEAITFKRCAFNK